MCGMPSVGAKWFGLPRKMRAVGLEEISCCAEQAIVRPVSGRSELDRSRALLPWDAFWVRDQCTGSYRSIWGHCREAAVGRTVVALEVVRPGRSAVRVPVGVVLLVSALLVVDKPVAVIVVMFYEFDESTPSWGRLSLV